MKRARQFVIDHDLVTIPPDEELKIVETPLFVRNQIPYAAYMPPGLLEPLQQGIFVVTPVDPNDPPEKQEEKLRGHGYDDLPVTALHEAYPGHHLQLIVANLNKSLPRLFGGFLSSLFIEGWAFYCEEMMAAAGFITDLETRLMQVNEMIWRAVRVIVDVKLSRGEMTFEDAVKILVEETGMSEDAAQAEVNWYTQEPGYPLSYLLGKHLLLQLKEEVKQQMGDQFDERFFNDIITANGYLPISLLHQVFTSNQHLTS